MKAMIFILILMCIIVYGDNTNVGWKPNIKFNGNNQRDIYEYIANNCYTIIGLNYSFDEFAKDIGVLPHDPFYNKFLWWWNKYVVGYPIRYILEINDRIA